MNNYQNIHKAKEFQQAKKSFLPQSTEPEKQTITTLQNRPGLQLLATDKNQNRNSLYREILKPKTINS